MSGIGFDDDALFEDEKRILLITGGSSSSEVLRKGCNLTVGKRTAADPHKYIDGPANEPGSPDFRNGTPKSAVDNFVK